MSDAWLIAGLGNPGPDYSTTRHNVGYMAVDRIAAMTGGKLSRHKRANAMVLEGKLGMPGSQTPIILVESLSYMNESGGPIKALMQFYDIPVERLIAIHDELDIPVAALRVKLGGGENGHNGLKSMRKALGARLAARILPTSCSSPSQALSELKCLSSSSAPLTPPAR